MVRVVESCVAAVALAMVVSAPLGAEALQGLSSTTCADTQAKIAMLTAQIDQTTVWDDATLARAQASLGRLKTARQRVLILGRRLQGADYSASLAANFDANAEARVWQRNADDLRGQIKNETEQAKIWALDSGVHCPGCTYSTLVSKVESAVNQAVIARNSLTQLQRQLAANQTIMSTQKCGEPIGPERGR